MKRHLAELKSENAQQTPTLIGKRSRHSFAGTPIAGLANCHNEIQVDTPESVGRSAAVPGTTERRLAGFTLNTPIAGLSLQTPPGSLGAAAAPGAQPGQACENQENGLPWLGHTWPPCAPKGSHHPQVQQQQQHPPRQQHPRQQPRQQQHGQQHLGQQHLGQQQPGQQQPRQQQLQQQQPQQQQHGRQQPPQPLHVGPQGRQSQGAAQQQLSFQHHLAVGDDGRKGTVRVDGEHMWFGMPFGSQQPTLQLSQQQHLAQQQLQEQQASQQQHGLHCSQEHSLSLGHMFKSSHSEARTATPCGAFGSQQPVEEVEQSGASPPSFCDNNDNIDNREGRCCPSQQQQQQQAQPGQMLLSREGCTYVSQDCTPVLPSQAGLASQESGGQQALAAQPHMQVPPHPVHRCGQARSPLTLSPEWGQLLLGYDSSSRTEAVAGCTPLSEDDFFLKASQSYQRAKLVDSPVLPGQPYALGLSDHGGGERGRQDDFHTPLQPGSQEQPCSSSLQDGAPLLSAMVPGQSLDTTLPAALTAEETTTPELECLGVASQDPLQGGTGVKGPGEQEATMAQRLFPIFRPRHERKCILLVRHGESTYNKMDAESKSWGDPPVFDAPLTQRGHNQAHALREPLAKIIAKRAAELGTSEPLWLVSPLTRAIETFLGACPSVADRLRAAHCGGGSNAGGTGTGGSEAGPSSSSSPLAGGGTSSLPNVVVLSLIAEHCATSGDVGRPCSDLRRVFPCLSHALRDLKEVWWYNPDPSERPNCHRRKRLGRPEPKDHMRQRLAEFTRWLHTRPERLVVAFGHSQFWKGFSNSQRSLKNCEFTCVWW